MATLAKGDQTVLPGFAWGEDPDDVEGRVLVTQHGSLLCVNTYLPNGGGSPETPSLQGAMDGCMAGMAGSLA